MSTADITLAKKIFSLLDLTSLNNSDTPETIGQLCQSATGELGHVAAICIYPKFIRQAKQLLKNSQVKIATVVNFPTGNEPLATVLAQIQNAIADGAEEIDVVMPYQDYLSGKIAEVKKYIAACKTVCGKNILLKVILETGVLHKPEIISQASRDVILSGADFIKTSTGKTIINATLEAAEAMLTAIEDLKLSHFTGLKISGGIRTIEQAITYVNLAERIMGESWINPNHFRIGASTLHVALKTRL
jgi:deoxyribose-phosphate aldolase